MVCQISLKQSSGIQTLCLCLHIHAQSQPSLVLCAAPPHSQPHQASPQAGQPRDSRCLSGGWRIPPALHHPPLTPPPPLSVPPLLAQHQCLPVPCCNDARPQQGSTEKSGLSVERELTAQEQQEHQEHLNTPAASTTSGGRRRRWDSRMSASAAQTLSE